jgi:hypothetical protein
MTDILEVEAPPESAWETKLHSLVALAADLRRGWMRLPVDAQPIAFNIIEQVDVLPRHVIPYLTPDWAIELRERMLPKIHEQLIEFAKRMTVGT